MSVTCGFYNSLNKDRKYNATHISSLFDGIINDGVFMSIGDALVVTAGSGMTVSVGEGRAWFNHTWTNNDAQLLLTAENSELVLDRIDAIVLEVDSSDMVRENTIKFVKGAPSSSPNRPTLVKTEKVNQYPLCYIRINAGSTVISQSSITNMVGTSECPFVTGLIDSVSIDTLLLQWQDEFNTWFETLEAVLDENVAGNLLNLINANKLDIETRGFLGNNIRGSLAYSGNVNLITKSGFYYCMSATNLPTGATTGYLIHEQHSSSDTYCMQKFTPYNDTITYTRLNVGGSWSNWYAAKVDRGGLPAGTNWNTLITCGAYMVTVIDTMTNAPSGAYSYGVLEIITGGVGYVIQRYTSVVHGIVWERTIYDGTVFKPWMKVAKTMDGTGTIPTTGWSSSGGLTDFPAYTHIPLPNIRKGKDRVRIYTNPADASKVSSCGLSPYTYTDNYDDYVTVYAKTPPTQSIAFEYTVDKGVVL